MALDLGVGAVMAVVMLPTWYAAEALAGALGPNSTWTAFLVLFVAGTAVSRPSLRGQAPGAARQSLPGLHRPDVPGG
jgi:hypothetical protein